MPTSCRLQCKPFLRREILTNQSKSETESTKNNKGKPTKENEPDKITDKVITLISSTVQDLADEEGWAFLGDVGGLLQKKQPNFDSRNYGFQKLTPLMKSIGKFEIEQRENQKGRHKLIYVKNKD